MAGIFLSLKKLNIFLCISCCISVSLHAQYTVKFFVKSSSQNHADDSLFLAGNFNQWNPKDFNYQLVKNGDGYFIEIRNLPAGLYESKFTRGSWEKVETNADGSSTANRAFRLSGDTSIEITVAAWSDDFNKPQKRHTASINVTVMDTAFAMPSLNRQRKIWLYLPKGYENISKRYPVLYMHDGQNLFDESTAGFGEWGVDEWMDSLIAEGKPACIIVGIENGTRRMNEYNPYDHQKFGTGEGGQYVDFIVSTLKPFVDKHYKTLTGKDNTLIAGSSMGGLISFYAMLKYPDVFGKAGIFSPAFWAADGIGTFTDSLAKNITGKFFFYAGGGEGDEYIDDMNTIAAKIGKNSTAVIYTVIDPEGSHNEAAWHKWFGEFYCWIMAPGFNRVTKTGD